MRLDDYLTAIGVRGSLAPDAATLQRLHEGHRRRFLFENLAIQTGRGISLALADLERKFLDEHAGGYCFEHNTLFATALRDVGFAADALLGRVRRGPAHQWGRTHMVLSVRVGVEPWLADVGFGALSLMQPIPFVHGARSRQLGLDYALRREGRLWVLSMRDASTEMDLYEFTDDPQTPTDVEIANHYTATHPASTFRRTLTIQRVTPDERITLRGTTLARYRDGRLAETTFERARLPQIARDVFGVNLPDGPFVFEHESALV